jgi:hypothetical protein
VDFQLKLDLNKQGICSSNEPFHIFGSYSFKEVTADDCETFPTFILIVPFLSLVDDMEDICTKHLAILTEDRRGMLFWFSPHSKDPTLTESIKNCKKYLANNFAGMSPITVECFSTIVEHLTEIQDSDSAGPNS